MIHYHGTPCNGTREDAAKFLKGRHALVPWISKSHLPIAAEVCQSFCLDNGAFSFWKRKQNVDWNDYYKWVNAWRRHPGFDFALIPDVIDGTEEENDALLDKWPFGEHYGAPVWHMHETLDRLARLCETWPRVALGSSGQWSRPGTRDWWTRMHQAMQYACWMDGKPLCKLHGLRMMDPRIFSKLPLSSADSTTAARNAAYHKKFGTYVPPAASTRMQIVAERSEAHNSAPIYEAINDATCVQGL